MGEGLGDKRLILISRPFREAGEEKGEGKGGRGGTLSKYTKRGELVNGSVVMWKNDPPSPLFPPHPLAPAGTQPPLSPHLGIRAVKQQKKKKKKRGK